MENKKAALETLEEGSLESKLSQAESNPCNKILAEADSASLCNLSEKCTSDVYSGQCEVMHVELSTKLGSWSLEESVVCDSVAGNNRINKRLLDGYADDRLSLSGLVNDNAINHNNVLVSESGSKSSLNKGIQIMKVEEPVEKSDELFHSHNVDEVDEPVERGGHVLHPHKTGVSGNGMDLFVEVFGQSDGVSEKHLLGKNDSNQEYSIEENGAISPDSEIASAKSEVDDITGEQECTFGIGDVVWIKTRSQSQLWWPGMISDPCNTVNDASTSEKRGSFLVKYYGSANFVWCDNSDLKPFLKYFEQMSVQNDSRNFSGSVDRALCEIGQRVKSKLTCPCFSKDSQMEEKSTSMNGRSKSDVLSLSEFEPTAFFARIRNLASFVNVPSKAELVVMRNCLSSFYCSIGHHDLPLHLMKAQDSLAAEVKDEGCNNNGTRSSKRKRNRSDDAGLVLGDKISPSGKGSESRERKKSKYLSYPYIDVKKVSTLKQETEDVKNSSPVSTKSDAMGSCSGQKSRKKGSKKPSNGNQIVSKADNIDACSAELLSELFSAACDYSYLSRSKYSDSLKRFYTSFRIFVFLDADIACENIESRQKSNLEKSLSEADRKMEGSKVVKASAKESVENSVGKKPSKAANARAKRKLILLEKMEGTKVAKTSESIGISLGKISSEEAANARAKRRLILRDLRAKKKKEQAAAMESTKTAFDIGSRQKRNLEKSLLPEKIDQKLPDIDSIARLPDLNGTQPSLSVKHIPVGEASTNLGKSLPEQRSNGLASPNLKNGFAQMIFASTPSSKAAPFTPQNNPQPNVANTGFSSFIQQSLHMGISASSASKPERKKRIRKEKTSQDASVIPDLNTNASDMKSPGKTLPEGNHASAEGKSDTNESGSNAKIKRVVNKVEDPGGSILLNFAPGCTVPPKETLVAKFSRFGLLKESEIQVLDDSSVKIAYERSSDARFAYRSFGKSNTFGESLLSFKLDCVPVPDPKKATEKKHPLQMPKPLVPVNACKNPTTAKELPDMSFIRQNVEKMKLTLEKAGDRLSPEMRAKLESEIKGFLDKISAASSS